MSKKPGDFKKPGEQVGVCQCTRKPIACMPVHGKSELRVVYGLDGRRRAITGFTTENKSQFDLVPSPHNPNINQMLRVPTTISAHYHNQYTTINIRN